MCACKGGAVFFFGYIGFRYFVSPLWGFFLRGCGTSGRCPCASLGFYFVGDDLADFIGDVARYIPPVLCTAPFEGGFFCWGSGALPLRFFGFFLVGDELGGCFGDVARYIPPVLCTAPFEGGFFCWGSGALGPLWWEMSWERVLVMLRATSPRCFAPPPSKGDFFVGLCAWYGVFSFGSG